MKTQTKRIISLISAILIISMIAVTFASCQKSDKKFTVGICQLTQHPALDAATDGFKDALIAELGEENIEFLESNASNDPSVCTTIINNFVSKKVDLILANATPSLQAAVNGTSDIPILGTAITEYGTALHINDFSGTVGGNVSGTSDLAPLTTQAQMILDLFPEAKTVSLLYCSSEPNSAYQVKIVKEYLESKGITCVDSKFTDSNDVSVVAAAAAKQADVIYIPTDNTAASCAQTINGVIGDTPVIAGEEGPCKGCGFAALTISYYDLGTTTGKMAAKILKGEADISAMPVEYVENFTKKFNPEKAKQIGYDVEKLKEMGFVAIDMGK